MLTLRLQRIGKNKFATYRLIVSEKARDTQGVYLEQLGTFNPHDKVQQFKPIADRVTYWISKGAQASGTVHNLLVKEGLLKDKKVKSVFLSKKRKTKVAAKKEQK
jgi:small subunit ribosomal protein S16